ncbi:WD repeat protein 68 [Pseudohyphozyma bogoriensis]|nr:WD repeat protein 68 [Pseudohyphozyma bogoriensis]
MPPSVLDYHSDVPTFALSFSPLSTSASTLKLSVGSYVEGRGEQNHLTIVGLDPAFLDLEDGWDELSGLGVGIGDEYSGGGYGRPGPKPGSSAFIPLARVPHPYPPSAISFSPARLSSSLQSSSVSTAGEGTREMVASSSDCLRLFDLVSDDQAGKSSGGGFVGGSRAQSGTRVVIRSVLANTKENYSAPLTAFSWSTLEPTKIVTSSIDTTCTVWDIANSVPITQLIAHDREVYDVAWSPASRDVFASVGADGSVRMFDLRSLEHSTILYEATGQPATKKSNNGVTSPNPAQKPAAPPSPLLRLAFSPTNPNYVSVCHADSTDVQILDTRNPGTPVMEVKGHTGSVNGMAWRGPTVAGGGETVGPGHLATCSDDSTLLLWDLSTTTPNPPPTSRSVAATPKHITNPSVYYPAPSEINAVAWGGGGDWIAAGMGRTVRCLKV